MAKKITPNDNRSNTFNPNNPSHKSAGDNRSNQLNPTIPNKNNSNQNNNTGKK